MEPMQTPAGTRNQGVSIDPLIACFKLPSHGILIP